MTNRPRLPAEEQDAQIAGLTQTLYECRRFSSDGLDLSHHRLSRDTALELQLAVLDRFVCDGDRLAGWKVSYTSGDGRDRMGEGFRPFGYILQSRSFPSGARVSLSALANLAVEPELCLTIGSPLRGPVDPAEARAAVQALAPAFELNEVRYAADADHATILADGCGQWGIVVGEDVPISLCSAPTTVELWRNGRRVSTSTPGDTMDDHYLSLSRLSARLHAHGLSLEPGQRVITGSFSRAKVTEPSTWRALFQGIGEVSAQVV